MVIQELNGHLRSIQRPRRYRRLLRLVLTSLVRWSNQPTQELACASVTR